MASIQRNISVNARPEDAWAAVRDFGAVHRRLAPGFVLDVRLDDDARVVTFANGKTIENAIWTYETPFPAMTEISGHLAFYPDKVTIEEVA